MSCSTKGAAVRKALHNFQKWAAFALKFSSEKEKTRSMVMFCGWGWRENKRLFCRNSHSERVLQERFYKIPFKAYRSIFLKMISGCKHATLFKKKLMHGVFPAKILNSSEQLFYSTTVNCCLWFSWTLVNFGHHLRFRQMPENFDHSIWFYKKYLKFRRSYETIWKPYLEHDIA